MLEFWALTSKGVEELLADEIRHHQGEVIKVSMGVVRFKAELSSAYQLCLWSRLATRIMRLIQSEPVTAESDLYQIARKIDWPQLMTIRQTLAVDCVGKHATIDNSQFGGMRLKDAIVDQFREETGQRPDVDRLNPDMRFQVRLEKNYFHFLQDFSGPSLHQRGYRSGQGEAPLKEHLAAALLKRSGWSSDQPLFDPFCGSGTIIIEAALIALNKAPGLNRERFAFEGWPGHRANVWQQLKDEARAEVRSLPAQILCYGSDTDERALAKARQNIARAGVADYVKVDYADATELKGSVATIPGVIVTNPPYGERLGDLPSLIPLYSKFSLALKQHYQGWRLAIITSNADLLRSLRLSKSKTYKFTNGPLDCEFTLFELTEKQVAVSSDAPSLFFNESSSFGNRLAKNLKQLQKWAKREGISCYRLYDADIPEYNVAVDWYDGEVVVHEYAAPATVDEQIAQKRLFDVVNQVPQVLGISSDKMILKVREKQKGTNQYQAMAKAGQYKEVAEYGAKFLVNLRDYLDTGLFLDHRLTRRLIQEHAKDKSVLNLFAYTGTASVHAAIGGAKSVTTVDMSNTYLDWAKRNFTQNGLVVSGAQAKQYQFEQADCLQWLARCRNQFDLIFVDPPTFSNSKRMEDNWDVQRDHVSLLNMLVGRLNPGGKVIFSNNKRRFKIDKAALEEAGWQIKDISAATLPEDFKRNPNIHVCFELTR
ncbi:MULTISPECIES: bifunctional 23S rRNA (guanine(2069)-N(7))-methyltransferase RlmK/23S rRNA (guanine(2445)-N(2))-methyltransferase RlmL [unclassified Arsukibacterium]|uniref:bifunctional 23S rRNA (guanine(2069)-N(7))-methyltransferase RlmK/23S rRNA (guanine(2445)-N(2))-methyltransferase RlmL n=1 Tax=unclassified Arsukibacterium TaxID=2635278 RepID=UPI000C59DFBC|nr:MULTISPECIES: bifunctional 23S rRNA (guanine(2069)-N(7))-methyltransferase RlmK/23S rRNA (guanine(2445)-N(2))-methyltransferase RlmL [unclassified Arsukibacterium]MBM33356.1 bifunctional 23S rRNA (guanine(2069)-N(7))-methyltransferase RlmK/23S rRNA (guanine(2445)-N(2))-methyltransferase RlmL [Rheinheimera sp.]|tara:strand:- start:367 stop:2496 length:2130 start_codon:yes stop_codon:yes gene_type:complete